MKSFHSIDGSIVAPLGFLTAGLFCDVKRLGTGKGSNKGQKRDLAVIVSEVLATAAGMFTIQPNLRRTGEGMRGAYCRW